MAFPHTNQFPALTDETRIAVGRAQQAALELDQSEISLDHLLYGVVTHLQHTNGDTLWSLESNMSSIQILELIKANKSKYFTQYPSLITYLPTLGDEARVSLEMAQRIAHDYNYQSVGLEHLIYSILATRNNLSSDLKVLLEKNFPTLTYSLKQKFESHLNS